MDRRAHLIMVVKNRLDIDRLRRVLNSVVSLYYYAAILKKMYLEGAPQGEGQGEGKGFPLPLGGEGQGEGSILRLSPLERGLLIILLGLTVLFGVWPTPLMELTRFSMNFFVS